jgi:putative sigma-54 modulation protein
MMVSICGRDLAPHSYLLEFAERRLQYALGRFGPRVQRVMVYLEDTNGPRGGTDKRCRMVARLAPSREVVVEGSDFELESLIGRTAERLGHSVCRELDRRRHMSQAAEL